LPGQPQKTAGSHPFAAGAGRGVPS